MGGCADAAVRMLKSGGGGTEDTWGGLRGCQAVNEGRAVAPNSIQELPLDHFRVPDTRGLFPPGGRSIGAGRS